MKERKEEGKKWGDQMEDSGVCVKEGRKEGRKERRKEGKKE